MNTLEWFTIADPAPMLEVLDAKASERKLRLFTVACARLMEWCFPSINIKDAVEIAEQYADGLVSEALRRSACSTLWNIPLKHSEEAGGDWFANTTEEGKISYFLALTTTTPGWRLQNLTRKLTWKLGARTTSHEQCNLIREIFGNPFRPASVDSHWLVAGVIGLARSIYEQKAFDMMPILADALQNAGCDNEEILDHCRSNGHHVRGCWVVDLLLGKE